MAKYKVTMVEQRDGKTHTLVQTAVCENEAQVVEFYGLREPDIVSYSIEEIQ